ncbi:PaeR7I family type II restriction endonuclease [Archangium lipolyticum]|uniref:PaeR7I family type II restriction endonuclease n=1 Tax=Archangium lipolyticum TaxID=2970465 RepID=UPI002149AE20|nr:PaeR7I family type II restriction endonuclease [Archangium lipolyticum]
MGAVLTDYVARTRQAVDWYWKALNQPTSRMEGFHALVSRIVADNDLPNARVHTSHEMKLPGFFTPARKWDMVVMHEGRLVAALGIRAWAGPPSEHGLVAMAEEAICTGKEMDTLSRQQAFGSGLRPWFGWLVLLKDSPAITQPAPATATFFRLLPEYRNSSQAERCERLLRELERHRLFDACSLLLCNEERKQPGYYREPTRDLGIKRFLTHLAGHTSVFAACR